MTRRILIATVAVLACACSPQAPAPEAPAPQITEPQAAVTATDPAEMVKALYAPYLANDRTARDVLEMAPWTDELRALLEKAMTLSKNEVILDADPIIAAQDWQLSNLEVSADAPPMSGRSVVTAKFHNLDKDVTVQYDLLDVNGAWRVDNIRSGDWDLRNNLVTGIAEVEKNAAPK